MKNLFLDIETLPADMTNPLSGKALKYLFERKLEKKAKRKEISENVVFEVESKKSEEIQFEEYVRGTSFDGSFGRVLCICLAVNDDEVKTYCTPDNEKLMLENFWKVAAQCDRFVGHNVMDFDLRFLWQRSVILGVKPTWHDESSRRAKYLSFRRYANDPIYDTMHEWSKWGRDSIGLEHIALALGIPTPKEGIDGSRVFEFYNAGKTKEIAEYCARDVETTRAVFNKMTFKDQREKIKD